MLSEKAIGTIKKMGVCLPLAVDPKPLEEIQPVWDALADVAVKAAELQRVERAQTLVGQEYFVAWSALDDALDALDKAAMEVCK